MLPVTVGVLRDWGSGKSSMLTMAATRLRDQNALFVELSPWRIETYDDAKTAILGAVLEEVAACPDCKEFAVARNAAGDREDEDAREVLAGFERQFAQQNLWFDFEFFFEESSTYGPNPGCRSA